VLLVDGNVLLYAINPDAVQHARARAWLDAALSSDEPVGFANLVLLAFVRLSTNPAAFPKPLTTNEACAYVETWLGATAAVLVVPDSSHYSNVCALLADAGTGGNLVNDGHLAALALEHDATIVSFDRDFNRFAGVRVLVPD
jgi:toxin-antitoxin system PIN domain toxin